MFVTRRRWSRVGWVFAGVLSCVGAVQGRSSDQPRLLTPADGPITQVLLAAPDAGAVHVQALAAVVRLLGSGVRYRVAAPDGAFGPVAEALRAAGARQVHHLPATARITPWVRDALFVLHGGNGLAWAPSALRRAGDASLAYWAARADSSLTLHPALALEGGNVVAYGRQVFVGGRSGAQARARVGLPSLAWHAVTNPGPGVDGPWAGRRQALYHLDLYFAAAGSPSAPVLLVGAVPTASYDLPSRVRGEAGLRAALDATAMTLVRAGFPVRRLPVLRIRDPEDGAPLLITYTNVLLDERAGRPVVHLPRYGAVLTQLSTLDGAAAAVYHDLGYAVEWYEGPLRALARAGGGLRCLVLETARGRD